jgi:hypothetical protein
MERFVLDQAQRVTHGAIVARPFTNSMYMIYPLPLMSRVHSDNVHVCLVLRDIKALACRLAHNSRVV